MTKRTKISKPSQTLPTMGFEPITALGKKAGAFQFWKHTDGRKVRLDYGLYSATGQSSRGMGAVWGFFLSEAA
jgi:hypothetical protein